MQIAHFPDDPPPRWHQPVLALGNFDGLHRGHMKIIDRVRRRAGERGGTPAAMTFEPHPPRVLRPDKAPPLLMTKEQKLEALARSGMQGVAVVRFTQELSRWDPETFVRTVLVEWLHVAEVWVGANFLFGHERAGTFSVLRSLGARYGFRAEKIDPVRYKDFVVSSTRIRRLWPKAASTKRARCSVITTSSTAPSSRGAPAAAASSDSRPRTSRPRTSCCRRPASTRRPLTIDGVVHPSITNIGMRPTFGDVERPVVETHIFDVDSRISTAPECACRSCSGCATSARFPDVDALRAQIDADCRSARRLFGRISL